MQILSEETASAIWGGFASSEFAQGFINIINGALVKTADFVAGIGRWLSQNLPGFAFFQKWFQDDPVGATAGALLGVVVIVVAGAKVGALGGVATLIKSALGSKLAKFFGMVTFGFLVGTAIRWAIRGSQFIWTFNWNITDSEIRSQQQGIANSLAAMAGGTAGSWLASLVCGAAPVEISKRLRSVRVRPDILARLKEISEGPLWGDDPPEIYEEAIEQLKSLLLVGAMQTSRAAFLESYKNIRKMIRTGARSARLQEAFPWLGEKIEEWGQEGGNAWSFASEFEERIESISNEALRGFTEEFFDEFLDQCSENLMIVSYAFG